MTRIKNHLIRLSFEEFSIACFVVWMLLFFYSAYPSFHYVYGKSSDRVTIHDLLPFDPSATTNDISSPPETNILANNLTLKNDSMVSAIDTGVITDHTITVSGSGLLKVKPNLATLHVSIETARNTEEAASAINLATFQKVISSFKNGGTNSNQTDNTGVQNISSTISIKQENNTKYTVTRSILIKTTSMMTIPVLLDKALKAGVNVDKIHFGLSEDMMDKYRINVMEKALGDAWKKARDAAILLDVRVIGIKSLSIEGFSVSDDAYFPTSILSNFASALIPSSVDLVMNISQSFLFKEHN